MASRKLYKRIKNDIIYIAVRLIIGFFRILPRRAALGLGSLLGRIAPYLTVKEYRRAVEHLTLAYRSEKDPSEIKRLAHETFRFMAMNFVDTVRLKVMKPEEMKSVCVSHNIDHLLNALDKGHGVIGLVSHSGCWEIIGYYLSSVGISTSAVARKMYDQRLEKMLLDTRTSGGIKIISRGHDTRDIIRVLKNGEFLAMLVDQDTKVKGVFVDFFGRPAYTATAPALLSLKYKSPIIPIYTYRDNEHRHHIIVGETVTIEPAGDSAKDILALTAACSKTTEDLIRRHPEQWVWFHRRWKTKPGDVPEPN